MNDKDPTIPIVQAMINEMMKPDLIENGVPKEKKISSYMKAVKSLSELQEEGWLTFTASDPRVPYHFHWVKIQWKRRISEEALNAKEFAKIVECFDEYTMNEAKIQTNLGSSLYREQ